MFHSFQENGLYLTLEVTPDLAVRLVHVSLEPFTESNLPPEGQRHRCRLLQIQATGEDQHDHLGSQQTGCKPADYLRYVTHRDQCNPTGRKIEIDLSCPGLKATVHWQFHSTSPTLQAWTELKNSGVAPIDLEHVSSFHLGCLFGTQAYPWAQSTNLHIPHNNWYGEAQWKTHTLAGHGLEPWNNFGPKRISTINTGSWSTCEFLPLGVLEHQILGQTLYWQIEHNGSWCWEISTLPDYLLYLNLSGPSYKENHWIHHLEPGSTFNSVPVAIGMTSEGWQGAMRDLTTHRRFIRHPHADNKNLPIIFNDYMNCLWANPTEENEPPLIDAAAAAGCEYYCIDAGWYSDGIWWGEVGEWLPSAKRFPNGLKPTLDRIRSHGMIPGLWLELEVVGTESPLLKKAPDSWFFQRNGKRITERGRYQLDFRHPEVRAHATEVIRRLVEDYGVGYIKMDYNQSFSPGTDTGVLSSGDGLLAHNRSHLEWEDAICAKYPSLVIENCASGGMRMDYAMLARRSIQSISDQTDYRKMAVLAASAVSAVTPEQSAVWSYPMRDATREVTVMNMVNAMLLRIHQSGHLAELSPEPLALVKEGLAFYKTIRHLIPQSLPLWPWGQPSFQDEWLCFGLESTHELLLAVWKLRGNTSQKNIPLPTWKGKQVNARVVYPSQHDSSLTWNTSEGALQVNFPSSECARIVRLSRKT
jgi:alpha-galactosidase